MARSHARIYTSIWADADFIALDPDAQRMFLFLVSQPDLEHSGVIPLRERRWSRASGSLTAADVTKSLEALAAARFLVYDEDTEELLVRSLMRWDGVWKQPNVAKSAANQIRTVASESLQRELACELARLGDVHQDAEQLRLSLLADLPQRLEPDGPDAAEDPSAGTSETPEETPSGSPSATPSGRDSGGPSRGGQGKGSTTSATGIPHPPGPSPCPPPAAGKPASAGSPGPKLPDMPDDPPDTPGQRANRLTKGFAALRPLSNFNAAANIVRKAVNAEHSDDAIADGLRKVVEKNLPLTTETLRRAIEGDPETSAPAGAPKTKKVNYSDKEYHDGW